MDKSKLIVIEGACDGIGKSTQFDLLNKYFIDNGIDIINHHFPTYDSIQGKPVEKFLNGEYGNPNEISPYFINTLYAEDRAITWYTKLKKEFDNNKTILLDRYTTSSLIYQSALIEDIDERKKFIDYVIDFEYNKLGIKEPDQVIFLYAPYDIVKKLREERESNDGVDNDVFERDNDYMYKIYENAMFVSDYLGWTKIDCNNANKMKSIEEIHKDIISKIK